MQKGVFHQMSKAIQIFVVLTRIFTIFLWRNHGFHTRTPRFFNNCIAVIAFIGNQILRIYSFNKAVSLGAIRCCALRNKHSDRHTMRIHGQGRPRRVGFGEKG